MKRFRFCSIAILILVLLAACGQDESQEVAYTSIHVHFAPSAPHQNVTKVMVYIFMHDEEGIERELDINGRTATGAVAVPIGELITVRVEAYEGDEVTYTGSEEVYIYEAGETVSVDIYLGSGGGSGDIYNIDIAGLRNGQRVSERTQIISGVIPESIAPNVDHGRIHLVNQQTGGSDEARLMNVGSSGSFSQEIVLASGENTIWIEFEDANNNVIGRTEKITLNADIPVMDIKVVLTWDSETDLDLHVIDPNGEDCYFFHMRTEIGGSLDIDDVDGYGPETFTLENAIPGDYTVEVVAFSLASQTANATVKVFLEDKLSNVFGPHLFTRPGDEWEIPQKIKQ